MKILFLIIMLLLFMCMRVHGQRTCGSELNLAELKQSDPLRYQRIMDLENKKL
ncbi:MAG: hypothetical protein LBV41_08445 [Cytophagaceae bacterium]|jgi:hypothetical protein|nr:hypothetical protein [Cytophagaceae bacterium]